MLSLPGDSTLDRWQCTGFPRITSPGTTGHADEHSAPSPRRTSFAALRVTAGAERVKTRIAME
ncbi:hypothetical protein trd_A0864 (plasmid) [Thermomicrobium roseum DSM 5159]|uniref:Uncharacterized protein n=1 Tax=Thermomicrobium roseum (strain ATCC 27502 / DSM 5159 / P-2) TaxID=309801 RepID=B9L501_THERP|nr:hypothetical protein trd_A0864 [Thermomicrobium roseum DSM 5159]